MRALLLVGLFLSAAGLAAQTPAATSETAWLVGEWVGGFTCAATGREGVLVLRVAVQADSLAGAVFLLPRAEGGELFPEQVPLVVQQLTVGDGSFRSLLARCDADEWALAPGPALDGQRTAPDRLEGTFCAGAPGDETVPQTGHWWAERSAPRASPASQ